MGFEKISANIGDSGVYIAPKTARAGDFQGLGVSRGNLVT